MEKSDYVGRIPLFSGLPPDQIRDLAAIAIEKHFERGAAIFREGDPGAGFYVVLSGRVKIYKISADGKEQILHIFGPGEPFGEVPVFEGKRFPAHAEVLDPGAYLFFPRIDFIDLIMRNPSLALNMLGMLSRRLRKFAALVDDLALKEAPARLAAYIVNASESAGNVPELKLDVSKGQLANMLGTIPETLSRILNKMKKQELIAGEGATIKIMDRGALGDIAQGVRKL